MIDPASAGGEAARRRRFLGEDLTRRPFLPAFLPALLAAAVLPWPSLAPASEEGDPRRGGIGNVWVEGEPAEARFPEPIPGGAVSWRALDDRGRIAARGGLAGREPGERRAIPLGTPGIGWYRVEALDGEGRCVAWTTAAVLARLRSPAPADSPIAVDSATAWFAGDAGGQRELARLAALAGVRWIRDRLRWRDLEPSEGSFAPPGTGYDASSRIAADLGLSVLQVFHDVPRWAGSPDLDGGRVTGRFARDLRHVYRFARAMAARFGTTVRAWEPWNEANVPDFGGHSIEEMAAWQKAAYLGFKSVGGPPLVGWNAYAGVPERLHTDGVILNECWPYFDTYDIHSYDWPESYPELWAEARRAACGKPIWVTEADRGMRYEGPKPWCELSREGELRKAEHMAHSYASSLFAGARMHYHFILGHYTEDSNGIQFGLLRLDRTPRPAYVALAALGRFLAGAKPLGRMAIDGSPLARVHAFRASPDGRERDVLVAWCVAPGDWSERGSCRTPWSLPAGIEPEECHDHLGRPLGKELPDLRDGAVFVLLPPGSAGRLPLEPPPAAAPLREGLPSPVVLQLDLPREGLQKAGGGKWSHGYEHAVEPGATVEIPFFAYDFAERPAKGFVVVEGLPPGARMEPARWEISLPPGERVRFAATYRAPAEMADSGAGSWIRLRGEFGDLGRPALAFRLALRRRGLRSGRGSRRRRGSPGRDRSTTDARVSASVCG